MKKIKSPWCLAYEQNKDHYSKEDIDNMLLCEIEELLNLEK